MNHYTVYKTETGIVEHVITTNALIGDCLTQDDETIVEGKYSPSKYKFINGEPIEQENLINTTEEDS
jgi:hypothetical protein|tara:strand:- start:457 stop:657 length:201 start_codon:yes stop_codon:yes gene_type:complete